MELLLILVECYTLVLLFRYILTQQELNFNIFGRGIAVVTDPVFKLAKVKKEHNNRLILLIMITLFLLWGLLLSLSPNIAPVQGMLYGLAKMAEFLTTFFTISVLLGSRTSDDSGFLPIIFHRLGGLFVKPVQRITGINSNWVVLPAIILIFAIFAILIATLTFAESLLTASTFSMYNLLINIKILFASIIVNILKDLIMAIFIGALMSWFSPDYRNIFVQFIWFVTEPVLRPIRRLVPSIGIIDVSAIIAIIVLSILTSLIKSIFGV